EVFQSLSTLPQTSGIPATAHLPVSYSQLSIILLGGGDASAYVDNIRGRQRHNTYPPPLLRPRDDSSLRDLVNFPPGVGSIDTIDSDLTYRTDSTYPYLGGVGYVPVKSPCNACRRLRFIEKIGSGEFGEVHKATIHSSSGMTSGAVAVKTVKHPDCTSEQASLTRECEILASLLPCSKFIIAVIGYCVHPLSNAVKCIIMEFCENGNLRNYLRKHGNQSYHNRREYGPQIILTSNDLMKFACQISEGMCFLADSNCLHRDLAARNVLITRDKDCRISDFGMAKQMNTDGIYLRQSQVPLPVRWMAPESIRDHVYTLKTEVWSFGIVLWEIATFGSTPYSDIKDAYEARTKILEGHKLEKPKHCRPE
ncbi:tyrosine kinase receptor Cad96Ca-like, partial [Saccoglossus kowalevskii]|uniref:Tyrosine kinase receptor Cad96Ca-like n=1 Tax=Saccoglossus kowalevskii TaxID=10224 RepID=A0ABM0N0P0_SACKO